MAEKKIKDIAPELISETVSIISPQSLYFREAGIDENLVTQALLKMKDYAIKKGYRNFLIPSITVGHWIIDEILADNRLQLFYAICFPYERMLIEWEEDVYNLELHQKVDAVIDLNCDFSEDVYDWIIKKSSLVMIIELDDEFMDLSQVNEGIIFNVKTKKFAPIFPLKV